MTTKSHNDAFTLIELLAVIAIIGLLIGLLMPAINVVRQKALEQKGRTQAKQIANAITEYKAEYMKWPGQKGKNSDGFTPEKDVYKALADNPRDRFYFSIPEKQNDGGDFRDPWKNFYVIVMDENGDGAIATPDHGIVSNTVVGVYCDPKGPKKQVCSWQ